MVELVVTLVLGTSAERRASSSLALGTKKFGGCQSVIKTVKPIFAPVVELAVTRDLKSLSQLGVRVRVSPGVQHFGVLAQR